MAQLTLENNPYKVAQVVKYRNTRGNIKDCEITDFVMNGGKNPLWFHGIDTTTKAKVYYPVHISLTL